MASLKQYLGKIDTGYDSSTTNKLWWHNFYLDFFLSIITNYFEWENLPDSIDKIFLEKNLCTHGFIAFIKNPDLGYIVSRGAFSGGYDIYDNPLKFKPVNNSLIGKYFHTVGINWYSENLDPEKAIIIGNNNTNTPSTKWLQGFCTKLADIEQCIQINRNAQMRPYAVLTDKDTDFTLKNLVNKMLNGDPVVKVKALKTREGDFKAVQLTDMVQVLDLKVDFLLDKLHDEKQRVINQVLTLIGVNNNAVDKAERLVKAEATANNGLINACIEVGLNTRLEAVERINKCHNLNVKVRAKERIEAYNTERLNDSTSYDFDDIEE